MDARFAQVTTQYTQEKLREAARRRDARTNAQPVAPATSTLNGRARRLPPPPSWWTGDTSATRESMVAAKALAQKR